MVVVMPTTPRTVAAPARAGIVAVLARLAAARA
jgi:hypothetical protein